MRWYVKKLTEDQLAFARGMTHRQWATLRALADFPFFLSATERADREIYAIIRGGMASCCLPIPGVQALFTWQATDAGKVAVRMRDAGKL